MYTNELEGNIALGFRAFDGSNYKVRCSVANYLAILLAKSQSSLADTKTIKAEDILNYLSEGFLHGHISLLKPNTKEQCKGLMTVQHEIRIGVTRVRDEK